MKYSAGMDPRCQQRLLLAQKDPRRALEQGWHQDPELIAGLFDRCEDLVYSDDPAAMELAKRTVEAAERHGDPHLYVRSYGVLSQAHIGAFDFFWAGKMLEFIREKAMACCPRCRSDHLYRWADVMSEERRAADALAAIEDSLREGGKLLRAAELAKRYFLRSICHHFAGRRRRALADVDRVLRLLPFAEAIGIFLDAVAFLAIWVGGGDPDHDLLACEYLAAFRQRLKNVRGLRPLHTRMLWTAAHLNGRLGRLQTARRQLEAAGKRLLAEGSPIEAAAVTLDFCILVCRRPDWGQSKLFAGRAVERCLHRRPDLSADHRKGLSDLKSVLENRPEHSFAELVAYRRSFVAPVPGVMAERLEAEG